ncbi:LysR family transcriptional regulator [Sphingobium sufflavum]|uniref:LysR family transcriptional regulator n=1 Tax=Sphingobium sufflavum TaxID=1129547 RepID=UPI001F22D3F8|nr:LysR family transcriptional regulator [Sphingobium sufflavum]MCE7797466.1 LysR family transcriptional regulator [Sphingobium sufflavum]
MERPTMRQLEILAEVARVGTFRGAARHLGLSQVAVSDHIRQLESRLGCALFVRNVGGKPTLSPSGKIVLEHGRNVLFACDSLISAARGAAGIPVETAGEVGDVAPPVLLDYDMDLEPVEALVSFDEDLVLEEPEPVAIPKPRRKSPKVETVDLVGQVVTVSLFDAVKDVPSPQVPSPLVEAELVEVVELEAPPAAIEPVKPEPVEAAPPLREKPITVASHPAILSRFQDKLAAAQEAFPERPIAVDFARFTPEAVAAPLASGRVDIALFYALGEVPGMTSDYLWSESWSLFARADHPLAQADMLTLADCVDMPVILFEDSNPLRALCEACLVKVGLWPAPTVLETDDFAAIATELLEYGEAVFPAFGVTAAQFAARPGLKRLALVEPLPGVQVRRAVGPLSDEDPTVSALAGLLG